MKKSILYRLRAGFSMVELVFAITVLGIVASMGSEIISQVYESYIMQRASHNSSVKTELVASQIANRLAYAIPNTIIGRDTAGGTFVNIAELSGINFDSLEWIGYDADGFGAFTPPAWSGFVDLDPSTATSLSSPGSNLANANTVIQNLSQGNQKTLAGSALFFLGMFDTTNIGYDGGNPNGVVIIQAGAGTNFTVPNLVGRSVTEQYKLAWTAYAIVPFNNGNGSADLRLYYNYQPWNGETYLNGSFVDLVRNISVFKFTGTTTTLRFKLCQQENIGEAFMITTCKEKVVIR